VSFRFILPKVIPAYFLPAGRKTDAIMKQEIFNGSDKEMLKIILWFVVKRTIKKKVINALHREK
jgi:hypothetical protein